MTEQANATHQNIEQFDLIVVGSGAGGMATAVTAAYRGLKVLVLEKADVIGGTTSWSGGWLWIPENPLAKAAGIIERPGESLKYVETVMGQPADSRVTAFLENGPRMVDFFRKHTDLQFLDGNLIPDFHDCEGYALGGRSVTAAPFDGRKLGKEIHRLRAPLSVISVFGMGIAGGQDIKHFFNAKRSLKSLFYVVKRLSRHILDLLLYRRGMQLVNGNALIAGLFSSANKLGVEVRTNAPVSQLLKSGDRVVGVEYQCNGKTIQAMANQAVVMATGGFPHDVERQKVLLSERAGSSHYSAAPRSNSGDGMNMAETAGATIENTLKDAYAWSPVSLVPDKQQGTIHFPHLIERAKPGIIAVLPNGHRFANEADSYHDFMKALYEASERGQEPYCWLIADYKAQRRWGLGWAKPSPFPLGGYIRSGYLKKGASVAELAEQIGVPIDQLENTIEIFNQGVDKGFDSEFKRGESPYNRVQGDLDQEGNPSLGKVSKAPFFAVKVVAGSLGTFAGIKTNELGQALNQEGSVISGLYAAGNDMSSIFNGHYPSGGITLGPAMTFGYMIANHLAASHPNERVEASIGSTETSI